MQRQPIPRAKTHAEPPAWPSIEITHSYQNYPVLPHNCNLYTTYTEVKPEFNITNFQNNEPTNTDINDLKMRRLPTRYDNPRTFYENPPNMRTDRTPMRSPNYLETRNYETNCATPRNVLDNSQGNYMADVSSNNYDNSIDKTRMAPNTIYSEEHRQMGDYSGYCETNQYKYEGKDEYVSAIHNALANVQSIDNIRATYNEGCSQYGQNCDRFPYPGLPGKKIEQMRKIQRCRTPEILLAPHYLEGCSRQVCCHWGPPYA